MGALIQIEMTAQEAKAWAGMQKLITQQGALQNSFKKTGDSGRSAGDKAQKAGKESSEAFDTGKLQKFAGLLGGLGGGLTVVGGLMKVKQWAEAAKAEIQEVAEGLNATHEGMKYLWQVSESKEAYESMSATYKLAMAKEGVTREQGWQMAFNLKSLKGGVEAVPTLSQTARYMDPATATKFYTRLTAVTGWGNEFATPEQAMSGLLLAAEKSAWNVEETAEWFTPNIAMARAMGASAIYVNAGPHLHVWRDHSLGEVVIRLPSGRTLHYPNMHISTTRGQDGSTRRGLAFKNSKNINTHTWGGTLAENVTQAAARDVLMHGMLQLDRAGYPIVGHVHDEVIIENTSGIEVDNVNDIMVQCPPWAEGLPLKAETDSAFRYTK